MKYFFLLAIGSLILVQCSTTSDLSRTFPATYEPPSWTRNAVIYEVNIRQYTPEGTFAAFEEHLPRLRDLGVDILWLMPIHPIGEERRKGALGSYYSIKDYKAVNPEFGSEQDFRRLVDRAHEMGFRIMLDWVANHSAFDHPWAKKNPEWYTKDSLGRITHPPGTDWTDVADLDYNRKEMRAAMIDAMEYWVREFDIDGYRCDVAGFVPLDFWKAARKKVDAIKKVFWLAEWEDPAYHEAFDMTYGWEFNHILNKIGEGEFNADSLRAFYHRDTARFPPDAYRMNFVTNHDENSWKGTVFERYGEGADAMAALTFFWKGMPLIYSGQEASLDKRLDFFGKDTIDWSDESRYDFYEKMVELHHQISPLWNGMAGAPIKFYPVESPDVLVMERANNRYRVFGLFNFSNETRIVEVRGLKHAVTLNDVLGGPQMTLMHGGQIFLRPWSFFILTN